MGELAREAQALERAMCTEQATAAAEFRMRLLEPRRLRLYRRLLWMDEQARLFRVAEDGTLADVEDEPLELTREGQVRVAHPARISRQSLERWRQLLWEYAVIPPFPQLERPVLNAGPHTSRRRTLRDRGRPITAARIAQLRSLGWALYQEAYVRGLQRQLASGGKAILFVDPGWIEEDGLEQFEMQRVNDLQLAGKHDPSFDQLDPLEHSELLLEINEALALSRPD